MDFNEIIFLKSLDDDWNNCSINLIPFARSVKSAAFVDGGKLKALSVSMHIELERGSRELSELLEKFCNRYNVPSTKSTSEKFKAVTDKLKEFTDVVMVDRMSTNPEYSKLCDKPRRSTWGEFDGTYRPIFNLINSAKSVLRACDSSIAFVNSMYKVDTVKDTRYDETTSQKALGNLKNVTDGWSGYCENFNYDEIEKYAADNKIDMGTPEYNKLIVKRLRAFKQDTISTLNKYFGKNSRFADLNIMDAIL